ncbi:MAG: FAD-dependent oxidoreductase [bacterium]
MTQNVIIIGGGAAGLSAAIYLARAGLQPLVIAGSPPGGQLMLTSEVENFPGQKSILGGELIDIMRTQATQFGATIVDENVVLVDLVKPTKLVELASGKKHETKAVIIATGAKALWMGLESEKRLRGKGVSACATCDGFFFKNKTVAVIGGGDSALEEALTITKFASKVYIIHRRAEFKASKIMQKRVLENKKIEVIWNAAVEEIGGKLKVENVKLKIPSGEKTIPVDGAFVAIGHRPDTDLFKGQIELDEKGYVLTTNAAALENFKFQISNLKSNTNEKNLTSENSLKIQKFDTKYGSQTSAGGVFGAGDCVDHVYKQASTAAGMGVQAALDAERWLGEGTV